MRRQELLGSVATYRVVVVEDDHVLAQVVQAPGLEAGSTVRLTKDAVAAMPLVVAAVEPAAERGDARVSRAPRPA